ncbi:holo-[acyl-carrier-protein] synthase [Amycolatopsis mediterranei S699]|uniref:Holo-[acyl-carrier-protein] synthase n=2 Tax=Amycolatopsis mediterranei TaxID=33910 RepID=A0A0H3D568_AMYMU|nr:4'-phosphopantetheinyl transferase superfamily protein [Amycolatopsis mediterranei]ADJ45407.1 holo-[acyl-carrier-protein] synthase [Amycolatopsis mediterranei U32]AEK42172.1 holo-[acyl-carrier-protein] synthase [Amycolatopsis mediterranei S699]AFO77119.1 holo-[acyl-carrier-protein] synthase [Amycolatopsis mediterranei S699]AGT84247.1 holo-[acyl-carrier-protein] synthase [Amycolatopsis mediterranei RB]KDO05986.1 DNA-binding protein [Amycolatopsis mediterranei]
MRLGIDLLGAGELDRLCRRRWFTRYAFAPAELAHAADLSGARKEEFLAGRFAAKEAVMKVLGVGLFDGVLPCDIAVVAAPGGPPGVTLCRSAGRAAELAGISQVTVSITHKNGMVAAVAAGW